MTTIVGPDKLCVGCNFVKAGRQLHYCSECTLIVRMIQHTVRKALRRRFAVPPGTKCVDCGRGAQVRDHRHYAKPLVVEYVCRTCNNLRGPALDIAAMIAKEKLVMAAKYPVDNLVYK